MEGNHHWVESFPLWIALGDIALDSLTLRPGESEDPGGAMFRLIAELYPICRSITGEGLRRSLAILGRHIPLERHEVPTGTPLFDWTVPREWNVRGAFIETLGGRRLVDFAQSNLHLLQYSVPVDRIVPREELLRHIHTLPENPDWIP